MSYLLTSADCAWLSAFDLSRKYISVDCMLSERPYSNEASLDPDFLSERYIIGLPLKDNRTHGG